LQIPAAGDMDTDIVVFLGLGLPTLVVVLLGYVFYLIKGVERDRP
jgi:hypothetical protein